LDQKLVQELILNHKLLLSPDEASESIGVKRATFFKLLAAGKIPSIKIGRLRRIPLEGLKRYVEQQILEQNSLEQG
jgi:excisionase family DNA binding protein